MSISDDTQILTASGFKYVYNISKDEKIAQYKMKLGDISFVKPNRIERKHYTGDMYLFLACSINILVTPDHKLLSSSNGSPIKKVAATGRTWGSNYCFPIGSGSSSAFNSSLTNLERLYIAMQCKAVEWDEDSAYFMSSIIFRECRKSKRLKELLKLLEIECYPYLHSDLRNRREFKYCEFRLPCRSDARAIKDFSCFDIESFDKEKAKEFIEELARSVGYEPDERRYVYTGKSKRHVDFIQMMCVLAGYKAHIHTKYKAITKGDSVIAKEYSYYLSVSSVSRYRSYMKHQILDYNGLVYNIYVDDGFIVTRRGDRVAIIGGNSV